MTRQADLSPLFEAFCGAARFPTVAKRSVMFRPSRHMRPPAGTSAPASLSTARDVLCQQGRHIGVGSSGEDLFFILHAFIIPTELSSKAGDGLPPVVLRPAVRAPLTFP